MVVEGVVLPELRLKAKTAAIATTSFQSRKPVNSLEVVVGKKIVQIFVSFPFELLLADGASIGTKVY